MKNMLKRASLSFVISAVCGLLVNLTIDVLVCGKNGMSSMTPEFTALFPTPVIAAYVNLLFYGLIGAAFAVMTFIFGCERIGFLLQSVIYFVSTACVWCPVTVLLWQLDKYPNALICTVAGYLVSFAAVTVIGYRDLKRSIAEINRSI